MFVCEFHKSHLCHVCASGSVVCVVTIAMSGLQPYLKTGARVMQPFTQSIDPDTLHPAKPKVVGLILCQQVFSVRTRRSSFVIVS